MFNTTTKSICPVCKDLLGWREKDSLADFYCKECEATYFWHPGEKKPTNDKGSKKPVKCGCGGCGR